MVACIMTVKGLGPIVFLLDLGFMMSGLLESLEKARIELNLQFMHK